MSENKKCIDCKKEINIPISYYTRCSQCHSKKTIEDSIIEGIIKRKSLKSLLNIKY